MEYYLFDHAVTEINVRGINWYYRLHQSTLLLFSYIKAFHQRVQLHVMRKTSLIELHALSSFDSRLQHFHRYSVSTINIYIYIYIYNYTIMFGAYPHA